MHSDTHTHTHGHTQMLMEHEGKQKAKERGVKDAQEKRRLLLTGNAEGIQLQEGFERNTRRIFEVDEKRTGKKAERR